MQKVLENINSFIKKNEWCDFEIINLRGHLKIGGKTGFNEANEYDILITYKNVFFIQCLYEWKTEVKLYDKFFSIADENEQCLFNQKYEVIQGNTVFKIIGEYLDCPMYIIAENISVEFPLQVDK
ncbi:hypothetical protein [Cyclobacterium plantarum]|uniref:Uncharacterized protein n=1 Tax=Cyclobacterium plantarum TaxID=2716263 RepID=A0ABX0HE93_9BACT|nr:hypothetical protein [Cyclobacterium plantarum]NHE58492.1 hypothetical protein [Cyclobacterium plantarum]